MPHLLSQEQQEEIKEEGEQATEGVSDRLSPVEMPPPPSGEGDLHHRLGYLEATLRSQEELLRQHRSISEQQASEVARLARQTEIQEQEIMKKETEEKVEAKQPGFFEKLLGGHSQNQ